MSSIAVALVVQTHTLIFARSTMFKGRAVKSTQLVNSASYTSFIQNAHTECVAWPNCFYVVTKTTSSGNSTLGQAWLMGAADAFT